MSLLKKASLLALDDNPLNLLLLEDFLQNRCRQLWLETDIDSALVIAEQQQPDIILLDIVMDKMDGYQCCQYLKDNPKTASIPIIFLSALEKPADKVKGFQVGGVDYIAKPFHIDEVLARIENCLRLHQQIQQASVPLLQKNMDDYSLSEREWEIFSFYAQGMQRKEIAERLAISENTVKSHLKKSFSKLDIKNRAQVVVRAYELGLIYF
jgi:DNA-binding NarL/FixJ family response regulator